MTDHDLEQAEREAVVFCGRILGLLAVALVVVLVGVVVL